MSAENWGQIYISNFKLHLNKSQQNKNIDILYI